MSKNLCLVVVENKGVEPFVSCMNNYNMIQVPISPIIIYLEKKVDKAARKKPL
jgi:hypothetical protein